MDIGIPKETRLREHARRTPRARHFLLSVTANAVELTPDIVLMDDQSRIVGTAKTPTSPEALA